MKDNININRKELTSSEIEQGKNFDVLLSKYKTTTKPFYKRKLFYASVGIAASVLLAVFFFVSRQPQFNNISQRPFIDPPCKKMRIEFADYIVPAEKGGTYEYKTGSKIMIPANAFMDEDGNIIKGKVNVKYREFHDQSDIMFSGIPMQYDSAGKRQLVSAGMLEIYAVQNGQSLKVNPQAIINVQMETSGTGKEYNTYYLDTVAKKWEYISRANITGVEDSTKTPSTPRYAVESDTEMTPINVQLQNEIKQSQEVLAVIMPLKPLEPKKADPYKQRFNIEVDSNQFPEVAVYKNVLFQVAPDEKEYNSKLSNIMWSDVTIKADKAAGIYYVTFSKPGESHTFKAIPVFDDKNYSQAKAKFDELYSAYQKKLTEKQLAQKRVDSLEKVQRALDEKAALARAKSAMENSFIGIIDTTEQKKEDSIRKQQYEAYNRMASAGFQMERVFANNKFDVRVSNFGSYNCDEPRVYPNGPKVNAMIVDENNNVVHIYEIALIEKNVNTVYKFYSFDQNRAQFTYDKKDVNAIWVVTSDGRIAIVDNKEFNAAIKKYKGDILFKAQFSDVPLDNIDKAKDFLYAGTFADNDNDSME